MIERIAAGVFVLLLFLSACGPDPTPKPLREYEILATAAVIQTRNASQTRPGVGSPTLSYVDSVQKYWATEGGRKAQQNSSGSTAQGIPIPDNEPDWRATEAAFDRWQATQDALYADDLATERAATMDAMMAEAYATDMTMLTEEAQQDPSGPIGQGTPIPGCDLDCLAAEAPWELDTFTRQTANLRAGPGTNYPVEGARQAGQRLLIIGQNPAGDWLQVDFAQRMLTVRRIFCTIPYRTQQIVAQAVDCYNLGVHRVIRHGVRLGRPTTVAMSYRLFNAHYPISHGSNLS